MAIDPPREPEDRIRVVLAHLVIQIPPALGNVWVYELLRTFFDNS